MNSSQLHWQPEQLRHVAAAPVTATLDLLGLLPSTRFPDAEVLNHLAQHHRPGDWQGPAFKDQGGYATSEIRYYEQIIAQDKTIPTREQSWHDLFNACIWLQFPLTKRYLNTLHMQDITAHGVHPRTARRNHITHFDECGVILAVPAGQVGQANNLLNLLATHQWAPAFAENRQAWQNTLLPFVFGHANLEMMLQPFVGLTGKWLAVVVEDDFAGLPPWQQRQQLDQALLARIQQLDNFKPARLMPPLPLLGVPGWYPLQDAAFYANQDYFRPLPPGKGQTIQLPLGK